MQTPPAPVAAQTRFEPQTVQVAPSTPHAEFISPVTQRLPSQQPEQVPGPHRTAPPAAPPPTDEVPPPTDEVPPTETTPPAAPPPTDDAPPAVFPPAAPPAVTPPAVPAPVFVAVQVPVKHVWLSAQATHALPRMPQAVLSKPLRQSPLASQHPVEQLVGVHGALVGPQPSSTNTNTAAIARRVIAFTHRCVGSSGLLYCETRRECGGRFLAARPAAL